MAVLSEFSVLSAIMWISCLLFLPLVAGSINSRLLDSILVNLDEDSSACGHYYNHSCGKYNEHHNNGTYFHFNQMLDLQVKQKFVKLMENLHKNSQSPGFNESSVEAKVLRFYTICSASPRNISSLEQYLQLAPPGEGLTWPQFTPSDSKWPQKPFNWLETLGYLHRYGLTNVFLSLEVEPNPLKGSEFRLDLRKPNFEEKSQKLNSFVETLTMLYLMKVPPNEVIPLARKIRNLEESINELVMGIEYIDGELISIEELEKRTGIKFHRLLEQFLGQDVGPGFQVVAQQFEYFSSLKKLMEKQEDHVVASYIMTRFGMYLLEETTVGTESTKANIHEINNIFEKLRNEFLLQVEHNRLELSPRQKRFIVRKAQEVILNIGNIPRADDFRNFASHYYEGLEFPPGPLDYHREHLKLLQFRTQKRVSQIQQRTQIREEYFHLPDPTTAEASFAYYVSYLNIIIVPLGLLQEPFFAPDSDDVFKYSLMGFSLAQLFMNAFDTDGITVDSYGIQQGFKSERFDEALRCMYRNEIEDVDDSLSDNFGLMITYNAYLKNNKNSTHTDFTHLPPEKIFFLNFGQSFCENSKYIFNSEKDQERLQQIVKGFEPFNKAFGCRRDGPQQEKCQVW
ncbi:neprilysin-1 [Drosophila eugracilis]|uniref:neprilysin-1 n=1 Tax=Drosophila eugracilis TaxID=29029 RepID=UPI001BDB4D19|nr:neprilysin-1 [Drosophila eugracilis]